MAHKKSTREPPNEDNIAKALVGLADGTCSSINAASLATGASRTTLGRRKQGGQTRQEAQQSHQVLSKDEEQALVKWVQQLSCTGHPVRHRFLRDLAIEIRKPRLEREGSPPTELGKNWVTRFLLRHPSLKSTLAKNIEAVRKEVTEEQLQAWFSTFKSIVNEQEILPENIYNMDETGNYFLYCIDCRI